jgi:hypothetical protein
MSLTPLLLRQLFGLDLMSHKIDRALAQLLPPEIWIKDTGGLSPSFFSYAVICDTPERAVAEILLQASRLLRPGDTNEWTLRRLNPSARLLRNVHRSESGLSVMWNLGDVKQTWTCEVSMRQAPIRYKGLSIKWDTEPPVNPDIYRLIQ